MKIFKHIVIIISILVLLLPIKTLAATKPINMYLFYGRECPHCKALDEALVDIKKEYPNLVVHKYEVWHNASNANLMLKAVNLLDVKGSGVPFTVIGTQYFLGYSETQTRASIEYTIKIYSEATLYSDPVGLMLGKTNIDSKVTYENLKKAYEIKNPSGLNDEPEPVIDIPLFGPVSAKTLSLPAISIIIGLIDGFNPCAMWVLLFLISVLLGMENRKRMWSLGVTFLVTSAIIYLAFMLAWLNLAIFMGSIWWIKLLIALVALIGGFLNLRAYSRAKIAGCEVVDEKKRKKIFTKVKNFTSQKSFVIAFFGVIALAISVNFIELTCSAGLPVIFTNILAINHPSLVEYAFDLFLYLFFFLIDDLIVLIIAMKTLKLTGISNKYSKYSHLVGGIIMIIIGLLLVLKPEWLMFNF